MNKTKIISVANQKGGVGKTTTAINLSAALFSIGKKVLVIDLDPQISLSLWLGVNGQIAGNIAEVLTKQALKQEYDITKSIHHSNEGFDFIPAYITLATLEPMFSTVTLKEFVLKKVLSQELIKQYDYVVIDCLPSLSVLMVNALTASDYVIVPVQTQMLGLESLALFSDTFANVKEDLNENLKILGILPTLVDNTKMSQSAIESLKADYDKFLFETCISKRVEASEASAYGISSIRSKNSLIGKQYLRLAKEVIERVEGGK